MSRRNRQARNPELAANEAELAPQESAAAAAAEEQQALEPKVQFDAWYAVRSSVIPAIHKKEILKADFKGRKVPQMATMAEFDLALKKYGVELV